jgi:hypothetical protein
MKAMPLILTLLFFCCSPVFAGQIYGTLRESGRPVPNVKIDVICGGNTYSAVTDNGGLYRLFAKETGGCTIRAYYQNQIPQSSLDSYPNPAHYDFDLIRNANGQYELRRR